MIQPFLSRQFVTFLISGGVAAAVNFGSRIVYNHWIDFSAAVILAYLSGMITAFVLARQFVFTGSRQGIRRSALFFCLVNMVAVAQTWVISMGLAYYIFPALDITRFAPEMAHGMGIIVPVFTSYIGHKRWSFR